MISNSIKPFLGIFSKDKPCIPPIWFMRQAGRHLPEYRELRRKCPDFIKFCLSPFLSKEAALQPIRRYNVDVAILFSDILMIPYALGQTVTFEERKGPRLSEFDWKNLSHTFDISQCLDRLSPVFESVNSLKAELPNHVTCLGFSGGPWTVASYMIEGSLSRDLREIKTQAYQSPKVFQEFLITLAKITAQYLIQQIKSGAEAIQIFESWAGFIPEDFLRPWLYEPLALIVKTVRTAYPEVPIIGYARGLGPWAESLITETGLDGLSFDHTLSLEKAVKIDCILQGNLDPILLLNPTKILYQETERILNTMSQKPFVFNVGQGLLPETRPELVLELIGFIRKNSH